MREEELRVGIYVDYYSNHADQWLNNHKLSKYDIMCLFEDKGGDHVDAIRLDENWLKRFGWVWNEECKSYEKYPNGDVRMNLSLKMGGSYTMFNYVLKATITDRIWYVHQLQNIYYALTNKEL